MQRILLPHQSHPVFVYEAWAPWHQAHQHSGFLWYLNASFKLWRSSPQMAAGPGLPWPLASSCPSLVAFSSAFLKLAPFCSANAVLMK